MEHGTTRNMLFHFLKTRNYNQDSGQLALEMGYDLGDYSASKEFYQLAEECAQLLRSRLAGVFNDKGEMLSVKPKDSYGEFHKENT
jgi:hypothetical protein